MMPKRKPKLLAVLGSRDYDGLLTGVSGLLDQARAATARVVSFGKPSEIDVSYCRT